MKMNRAAVGRSVSPRRQSSESNNIDGLPNPPSREIVSHSLTAHSRSLSLSTLHMNEWMNGWMNECRRPPHYFTIVYLKQFTITLVSNDIIEEATYSGIIDPSPEWHTLNHRGPKARLTYRVRVQCDSHYYNATCTKFCRARDDKFGHYRCDMNGDKECIHGWKGSNCETGKKKRLNYICISYSRPIP